MQKTLLTALAVVVSIITFSQRVDHNQFNMQRNKINKNGLMAIGSWSAANIIYGTIASSQTTGSTKYFHKMNAIWNGVTFGLSAFGYLAAKKDEGLSYSESLKRQASIEKVFLANVGLDVAYVAGGFYLRERSKTASKNQDRSKGYGESIILQGSVLLLFDALMYGAHNHHGKHLYKVAEKIKMTSNEGGIGLSFTL